VIKSAAIIGMGVLGSNLFDYLTFRFDEVCGYDIDEKKRVDEWDKIEQCDLIFVCVSTPYSTEGFDLSNVEEVIDKLKAPKIIVIRSTVIPGSTEYLQAKYPRHKILFSPEFLRENTAWEDILHPNTSIVGYTQSSKCFAPLVMHILPKGKTQGMIPATDAEMIKYARNTYLAMKVVFANQLYDLCNIRGVDYAVVRDGLGADPRIGKSHLDVWHEGGRGAGGVCFPKDLAAFDDYAGSDAVLFGMIRKINDMYLDMTNKTRGRQYEVKK